MLFWRTTFIFLGTWILSLALPNTIKLGVIIEAEEGDELEKEILKILKSINMNDTVLPYSQISPSFLHIKSEDRFHALKAVCNLSGEGVVAILASVSPSVNTVLQSAAQSLHIPHLEIQRNYRSMSANYSVNLYPDPAIFSKALLDMVEFKNWRSFTAIYQEHDSVLKIQDLFNAGYRIHLQRISEEENLKNVFKNLIRQGETHFILDMKMNRIRDVFLQAEDLGIMTEYHNYILTSFDFQTIEVDEFRHVKCNISGFSFLPSERHQASANLREPWRQRHEERLHYGSRQRSRPSFKVRNAVLHDTLVLLARALNDLDNSQSVHVEKLHCDHRKPWSHGRSIINYMKMINIIGETGIVKLDENGRRVDFVLDIMDVKRRGLMKVATWTIRSGMKALNSLSRESSDIYKSFKNKTLLVTALLNPPYITVNEKRKGSDRFEGFCADLLREISNLLGFRYEIRLVRDNSYGRLNERGEWSGMIRELVDKEVDLAVGDLTITSRRAEVVDFTMPFMNLGISILYKRPKGRQKNPFIFFSSLSVDVWLFTLGAYILASVMIYVTARFSPSEWVKRRANTGAVCLQNKFDFCYCFWFTLSALMRQGCQVTPRSPPTRLAALSWWFFTLIMISSYTANFAAFLTVERFFSPIENVDDLSKQTKIHYGCVNTGSTRAFFENSQLEIYKGMWEFMLSTQPNVLVSSNSEGVEKVLNSNYAFLMESSSIEYAIERHCELMQVGNLLDSKSYGLALPHGSPYTQLFTKAILILQEDGTLHRLKERWWKVKNDKNSCPVLKEGPQAVNELGLYSIGGVFVVLLAGLGLSCLSVIVEIVFKHQRKFCIRR